MVNTVELHYKVTRHYNIPHINIVEVFKTLQNDYQKFFAIRQFRSDVFGHLSLLGHRLVALFYFDDVVSFDTTKRCLLEVLFTIMHFLPLNSVLPSKIRQRKFYRESK